MARKEKGLPEQALRPAAQAIEARAAIRRSSEAKS